MEQPAREQVDNYEEPDSIDIIVSDVEDVSDDQGKKLYTTYKITTHVMLNKNKLLFLLNKKNYNFSPK